jgi:hypothetical protein
MRVDDHDPAITGEGSPATFVARGVPSRSKATGRIVPMTEC